MIHDIYINSYKKEKYFAHLYFVCNQEELPKNVNNLMRCIPITNFGY